MKNLRENFSKVYANIPLSLRDDIILVFEEKPITWNVAYFEVKINSEKNMKILMELRELKII